MCRGIPRVINMVCDGSLLIGYANSKRQIDVKIVNEAIEDLRLFKPTEAKKTLWWRPVYQLLERVRSLKPAVHPADGREEPVAVPEPVPVPRPRWRLVYQLLERVRSLKPAVRLAQVRTLWWRPVYQLLERVRSLKPAVRLADGREEPAPVLTTESVPEPLTLESSSGPLQAEGSGREEPVLEPVPVPYLRWRPVYQTLTGALLGMVALGLFNLFIWDRAPREGMTVKGTRTVIAERGSTLPVLAEQSQGLPPVPNTSAKRARPQRLVHKQGAQPQGQRFTSKQGKPPEPLAYDAGKPSEPLAHDEGESPQRLALYRLNVAERADLLFKQDAAWRVLQR